MSKKKNNMQSEELIDFYGLEEEGSLALQGGVVERNSEDSSKSHFVLIPGGKANVDVSPVLSQEDLLKFVQLPHKIYQNDPSWIGQDDAEELARFNPEINTSLQYLKTQLFIAEKKGEVVGRICATINDTYNRLWNQNIGFVGFYESVNDQDVANMLLKSAEAWIRKQGKTGVYGPFSFTSNDTVGFVIEGFNEVPTHGLAYNPDYYPALFEKAEYSKVKDVVELLGSMEDLYAFADKKFGDADHITASGEFTIREFDPANFDEDVEKVRRVFNTSFARHWGFCPIAEDECLDFIHYYYDDHIPEGCFFIMEHYGKPVGFSFFHEDGNQRKHGQRFNLEAKPNRIKAYIMGILPEYQTKGVSKVIWKSMSEALKRHDFTEVSYSWIVEDNHKSMNMCKGMGGQDAKVFRIFEKKF